MQEIALAKLKEDGLRILQRHVVLPTGSELSNAETAERAARDEAQTEADDGSGKVPRAHSNTAPADSATD